MEIMPHSRAQRRLIRDAMKYESRRQAALEEGQVSLASGEGKLAIIVSKCTDNRSVLTPEQQYASFLEEADRLKAERSRQHGEVAVRKLAVITDMKIDFMDPEVTDIVLIGHGSIGCFWANGDKHFTWKDAAKAATRLKQGKIEQRMCGNFPHKDKTTQNGIILVPQYSIPLGTFAVTEPGNVLAALHKVIPDRDPPEAVFQPVYESGRGVVEQVIELNERYAGVLPETLA